MVASFVGNGANLTEWLALPTSCPKAIIDRAPSATPAVLSPTTNPKSCGRRRRRRRGAGFAVPPRDRAAARVLDACRPDTWNMARRSRRARRGRLWKRLRAGDPARRRIRAFYSISRIGQVQVIFRGPHSRVPAQYAAGQRKASTFDCSHGMTSPGKNLRFPSVHWALQAWRANSGPGSSGGTRAKPGERSRAETNQLTNGGGTMKMLWLIPCRAAADGGLASRGSFLWRVPADG